MWVGSSLGSAAEMQEAGYSYGEEGWDQGVKEVSLKAVGKGGMSQCLRCGGFTAKRERKGNKGKGKGTFTGKGGFGGNVGKDGFGGFGGKGGFDKGRGKGREERRSKCSSSGSDTIGKGKGKEEGKEHRLTSTEFLKTFA